MLQRAALLGASLLGQRAPAACASSSRLVAAAISAPCETPAISAAGARLWHRSIVTDAGSSNIGIAGSSPNGSASSSGAPSRAVSTAAAPAAAAAQPAFAAAAAKAPLLKEFLIYR